MLQPGQTPATGSQSSPSTAPELGAAPPATIDGRQSSLATGGTKPAAAGPQGVGGQDIVVTAEKRSSTIQRTPLAIVAVDSGRLQSQHIVDTSDLGTVVPNLQIVPIAQTIQINIRGVGSNFFDPRGESSVSQSIDGLYYLGPPKPGAPSSISIGWRSSRGRTASAANDLGDVIHESIAARERWAA